MKHILCLFCLFSISLAQVSVVQDASRLEEAGKFKEADSLFRHAIVSARASERKALEFELDRLGRIKQDFSLTKMRLSEILKNSIRDFSPNELDQWIAEGKLDFRLIDGEQRFVGTSRSNLFWLYQEIAARRLNPPDEAEFAQNVFRACTEITTAARVQKQPYVLPKRFKATMTLRAKANAAPAGATVRAWMPIPRAFLFQKEFRVEKSSNQPMRIDTESSSIRSAYFEAVAIKDKPTEFRLQYSYTHFGIRFDLDPATVKPLDAIDPSVRQFTMEGPHVVFTDRIKNLSSTILGTEPNPLLKAKKLYEWIAGEIKYSYAIEYSTIRNISDYCAAKMYGDCGQEALLFITLCRYNGIPARWQSAWLTIPGGKTIHDWTEIYLAPWGWIPVDPYMGIFAVRYLKGISDEEKTFVRDFYFGGLDQYRMSANSDHCQELNPPKRSMRSDNVDFQRGEMEYGSTNIYFDKYSYELTVEEEKIP